jgi:hypothetical protein
MFDSFRPSSFLFAASGIVLAQKKYDTDVALRREIRTTEALR